MRRRVRGWEEVRWRARGRELWRVRKRGERELIEVDKLAVPNGELARERGRKRRVVMGS